MKHYNLSVWSVEKHNLTVFYHIYFHISELWYITALLFSFWFLESINYETTNRYEKGVSNLFTYIYIKLFKTFENINILKPLLQIKFKLIRSDHNVNKTQT